MFYANTAGIKGPGATTGQRGDVPVRLEEMSSFHKITLGIPVSINEETEEGLTAIPGVGPVTAGAIVAERDRRGGFRTIEELMSVRGIGKKTFDKIKAYVTL